MTSERYGIDLLVIGAGVIGAAVAHHAAATGMRVTVVDRQGVAGGSTGAGEGNLLVSDKAPGPELDLALLSSRLWSDLAAEVGGFEYETKGGLVVTSRADTVDGLRDLVAGQRRSGVTATEVDDVAQLEPHLRDGIRAAVHYPQDAQVMPALAAARLLDHPNIAVHTGVTVTGAVTSHRGRMVGVVTSQGQYSCGNVVVAAGAVTGQLSTVLGAPIPITPRRGVVLVTAAVPPLVRHKVYTADYLADVASDDDGLQTSPVVEGTPAGPILIGASRERVGFERSRTQPVWRRLAAGAVDLFPVLREVPVIRAYSGFRPFSPDHLPVIGPDDRLPGLWHASGHEGAGVGLAAGTGRVLTQAILGELTDVDLAAFSPARFEEAR